MTLFEKVILFELVENFPIDLDNYFSTRLEVYVMKLIHLKDLSEAGASDNPKVVKKVIISKGLMPGLMMFSRCFFKPGQETFKHKHPTMFETYYILEGEGMVNIDGKEYEMKPDDCIVIEPGEEHFVKNIGNTSLSYLYFGLATD